MKRHLFVLASVAIILQSVQLQAMKGGSFSISPGEEQLKIGDPKGFQHVGGLNKPTEVIIEESKTPSSEPLGRKEEVSLPSFEEEMQPNLEGPPTGPSIGDSDRKMLNQLLKKYNKQLKDAYNADQTIDDMISEREPYARKGNKIEQEVSDLQRIKLLSQDAWQSPFIKSGSDPLKDNQRLFDRDIKKFDADVKTLLAEPDVFGKQGLQWATSEDVLQKLIDRKRTRYNILENIKKLTGLYGPEDAEYYKLQYQIRELETLLKNLQDVHEGNGTTELDTQLKSRINKKITPQRSNTPKLELVHDNPTQDPTSFFSGLANVWYARQEAAQRLQHATETGGDEEAREVFSVANNQYLNKIESLVRGNRTGVTNSRIDLLRYIKNSYSSFPGIDSLRTDDSLEDSLNKLNTAINTISESEVQGRSAVLEYLTLLRDVTQELKSTELSRNKPLPTPKVQQQTSSGAGASQSTESEQIQKIKKTGGVQVLPGFVPLQETGATQQ
ncbi:MAG: hypothetical protein WCE21_05655 [Candidatus Babeliales bacterium]